MLLTRATLAARVLHRACPLLPHRHTCTQCSLSPSCPLLPAPSRLHTVFTLTFVSSVTCTFTLAHSVHSYLRVYKHARHQVLANRPGFPFLGNDFYGSIGDVFGSHAVNNPSIQSEMEMLRQYMFPPPLVVCVHLICLFISNLCLFVSTRSVCLSPTSVCKQQTWF
jgi:hypothetical protein